MRRAADGVVDRDLEVFGLLIELLRHEHVDTGQRAGDANREGLRPTEAAVDRRNRVRRRWFERLILDGSRRAWPCVQHEQQTEHERERSTRDPLGHLRTGRKVAATEWCAM